MSTEGAALLCGMPKGCKPDLSFEPVRDGLSLQRVCENSARTADLSTPLRSGRDDKFVKWFEIKVATNLSSRPERSGVERSAVSGPV